MQIIITKEINPIMEKLRKIGYHVDSNRASKDIVLQHLVHAIKQLRELGIRNIEIQDL